MIESIKENDYRDEDFIEYLKNEISPDWQLPLALDKGIAFHHADMPSYVKNAIISSYNEKKIKVIVCTNAITEGVNTSAKKVIILDNNKGKKDNLLTAFEVKNIKGRAGRFLEHFVGDVYTLAKNLIDEDQLESIDFSYLDCPELEDEEIIQIDDNDLNETNNSKKKSICEALEEKSIDFSQIKKNRYIDYQKQINLIEYLRNNLDKLEISFTGQMPNKDVVSQIFHLCENYLFSELDKNRNLPFRGDQLLTLINFYISNHYKSPIDLLNNEFIKGSTKNIDTRVRYVFKFISDYCGFKLPKYFYAFQNIYNYVNQDENLSCHLEYFILKLEFGTAHPFAIELNELGNLYQIKLKKKILPV